MCSALTAINLLWPHPVYFQLIKRKQYWVWWTCLGKEEWKPCQPSIFTVWPEGETLSGGIRRRQRSMIYLWLILAFSKGTHGIAFTHLFMNQFNKYFGALPCANHCAKLWGYNKKKWILLSRSHVLCTSSITLLWVGKLMNEHKGIFEDWMSD